MTEEEFLKSTPRKLFKLADIHLELNSPQDNKEDEIEKKKHEEVYIDNLFI